MVTVVPTPPLVGEKELIIGEDVWVLDTVNEDELVPAPPGVVTLIGPDEAPEGTEALIEVLETTLKPAEMP
jgi:hypothetical protein